MTEETLPPALDGVDGVFHLAGKVARESVRDALYALHVDGIANVLRAMAHTSVRRVVLASTSGTVAVSAHPVVHTDESPYATDVVAGWPYYASKIHAEHVARRLSQRLGIELVLLRPSLLLGPEDFGHSSTDDLRRFMRGEYPVVPRGGMCFVDVRDCAATFVRAMDRAPAGEAYLIGGANTTLRDFFTLVANIADVEPPVAEVPPRLWKLGVTAVQAAAWLGYAARPDNVTAEMARHFWYADWSKAAAHLGHTARPPIETLEDTVTWLQSWGELPEVRGEPGKLLRLPFRPRPSGS
jgi:dihydroflavonol-4-reductase